jgi:hypothetical protein
LVEYSINNHGDYRRRDSEVGTVIDPLQQGAFELFNNFEAATAAIVLVITAIGASSRSLAVGSYTGYLAFAVIALETGTTLFVNIVYVTVVLFSLGFAFKLWRLEFGGEV